MTTFTEPNQSGHNSLTAGDILCTYDLRGALIEVGDLLEQELGYSRHELLAMEISELLTPESWEIVRENTLAHLGGSRAKPRTIHVLTKSGRCVSFEIVTKLLFEEGSPIALQAFAIRSAERLPAPGEYLTQLHRLSTTQYESLSQMFADCLKTCCHLFRLPTGMILQMEGDCGVVRAVYGAAGRLHLQSKIDLAQTPFSSVAARRKTFVRRPDSPLDHLMVCLATPIHVDGEPYGALSFSAAGSTRVRCFTREEIDLVELIAARISHFLLDRRSRASRKRRGSAELATKADAECAIRLGNRRAQLRNQVLEMIAQGRPLAETMTKVAHMVENRCPGRACAVLIADGPLLRCLAAPSLPVEFALALNRQAVRVTEQVVSPELHGLLASQRFAFTTSFGLELCHSMAIVSSAGLQLGAILLLGPQPEAAGPDGEEIIRLASRMATIAIEQRHLTDRLAFHVQHDFLTGLANRFHLVELLKQRIYQARRDSKFLTILFIDLDRFSQINDTLGHEVGDRLLIEVADRLKSLLANCRDVAARVSGDEFGVVLVEPTGRDQAIVAAGLFLEALRLPYRIDGRELFVTPSIGISFYPTHGEDASTLLRDAEAAMYRTKKDGKNAIACYSAQSQPSALDRLDLESALRRALEKAEFELNFQPIVSMEGDLEGLEALLTWNHATRGKIRANSFIPMAEETGLIVLIGSWVLGEACRLGAAWLAKGLPVKRIAVNVSAIQFSRPNFLETIWTALASSGFPPRLLELELTESVVLRDIKDSIERIQQIRALGVKMAIDDFGTGYSSLNYLRRLPVDELKIDQSFLRDLRSASDTLTVVQAIVSLAHSMKLSVVAEGVETVEELELLRAAGCDQVQGYLFCGAMPVRDVENLLASPNPRLPIKARSAAT